VEAKRQVRLRVSQTSKAASLLVICLSGLFPFVTSLFKSLFRLPLRRLWEREHEVHDSRPSSRLRRNPAAGASREKDTAKSLLKLIELSLL
jgi:hypothetical protein